MKFTEIPKWKVPDAVFSVVSVLHKQHHQIPGGGKFLPSINYPGVKFQVMESGVLEIQNTCDFLLLGYLTLPLSDPDTWGLSYREQASLL